MENKKLFDTLKAGLGNKLILRVHHCDNPKKTTDEVLQVLYAYPDQIATTQTGEYYLEDPEDNDFIFTPHLFPLSMLTKPITVEGYNEGKEFVPIIKLYHTSRQEPIDQDVKFEYIKSWGDDLILRRHFSNGCYDNFIYSDYSFSSEHIDEPNKKGFTKNIKNQHFLHEYLSKWHFNVFNLDQDQFIDASESKVYTKQ